MEETQVRPVVLEDIRASVRRLRQQVGQLLGQLGRDARRSIERSAGSLVDRVLVLVDVRKLRAGVHKRAELAVREVAARRVRAVTVLQGQLERLADPVVKELKAATDELEGLKQRIAEIERRLEAFARDKAHKDQAA